MNYYESVAPTPSKLGLLFSEGLRPFFLGGAVWAIVVMSLWIGMLTGRVSTPTILDPITWHAHALLFGYVPAIIAGFLLTAVPNWTGRTAPRSVSLGALFTLWASGRAFVMTSEWWPFEVVSVVDVSFLVVVSLWAFREICFSRNWSNLLILGLLSVLIFSHVMFYREVAVGADAANGLGLRLAVATIVMMIAVVGGRIVPSFTRNWMLARKSKTLPPMPMQLLDRASLVALFCGMIVWILLPHHRLTVAVLFLAGLLNLIRLWRWKGHRTLVEPLVTILHIGYVFVPLGALVLGVDILQGNATVAAQHVWMVGAIGVMTLAVMTRASLGHTGRELRAGPITVSIYLAILTAVLLRSASGVWSDSATTLYLVSGAAWILAFSLFVFGYSRALTTPNQ